MRAISKSTAVWLCAVLLALPLGGCRDSNETPANGHRPAAYQDTPGITDAEIAAIETLRKRHDYFTYTMIGALLCALTLLTISYTLDVRKKNIIARQAAMLTAIYDSTPAMVFTKDLNNRYTSCNVRFEEEAQLSESQLIGTDFHDIPIHDKGAVCEFFEANKKVLEERVTATMEGWFTYPNNVRKAKKIVRSPLLQNGKVVGLLGIAWDITEQKLAEEAAESVHERTRIMLDSIPLACLLINKDHECIDCNDIVVRLFEQDDKQAYLARFNDFLPEYQPDGRHSVEMAKQAVTTTFEEGSYTGEWTAQLLDGTPIPTANSLVRVSYGGETAVLLYAQDLRKQKRLERRIETMLDNLSGMVFQHLYDPPNFTYTFVSKGCEELLGYTSEEMLGKSALQFVHPDDIALVLEKEAALHSSNAPFEAVVRVLTKDGAEKSVWVRNRITETNPDGSPLRMEGYLTDVSERWRLEAVEMENRIKSATIDYTNLLNSALAKITTSPAIAAGALKDVAEVIAREGCHALGVTRIGVWSVGKGRKILNSISCYEISTDECITQDDFDFVFFSKLGPHFSTHRLLVTDNVRTSPWWSKVVDEYNPKMCASLGVPVWNDGVLAGIVRVEQDRSDAFPEERKWTIEEQNFAASLADLMALAISSAERREARDAAESASLAKSAAIEYTKKLSSVLASITTSPSISSGVLKDAADFLVREGCKAVNATRVGMWVTTQEPHILKSVSCYDNSVGAYIFQNDFDLSGNKEHEKRFQTARLIVTKNVTKSNVWSEIVDDYNPNMCASLGVPIRVDGKVAAAIHIEQDRCEAFPEGREWTIEERNFAASLADLMALAISGVERREARDAAEAANRAKSAFLAMMSHEIRTPMNVICGITEILQQDETLPEGVAENLDRIHSSSDLLLGIINDILDFSKIEAGKMDITSVPYKVASLINDAVNLNRMRIGGKPIEFKLQVDENIPAKLIGDELRIKQILNNVLSNAFKYTEFGTVTLSVAFEPSEGGITLILSVQDTGCGMTEEQIGKLFGEYSRFNPETSRVIEGTGLGLAITHRLVTLMHGSIHVESEAEKGSLFIVRLPQGTAGDEVLGKELAANLQQFQLNYMMHGKQAQIVRDPMPYGSVLIVDDMETNLYVAVGLMRSYGLRIDTAMSGAAAIDKINAGNVYDVVFMDHMMPKMDGIETTKRLRAAGYTHPIVVLTANAVSGQAEMFLQSGFDSFISKPIDTRQLNAVLNKLVRDKQPREVVEAARRQKGIIEIDDSAQVNPLLMESFIRDARRSLEILESACQSGQWGTEEVLQSFIITVHGIKGSLGNIGELEFAESASQLESAARERDFDLITTVSPSFLERLRTLLEKLESEREESGSEESIADLRNRLLNIQAKCESGDKEGALKLLAEVTKCSKETRELLDGIEMHVYHGEFAEAAGTAVSYANVLAVVLDEA